MSHAALGTTDQVKEWLAALKANDCSTDLRSDEGTAVAYDGETKVFAAIQKGRGGPWIIRFINSERIKWSKPDGT